MGYPFYGMPGASGTSPDDIPANPANNQDQQGRTIPTPYGAAYRRLVTASLASPRWLPGPYHFRSFAGVLMVAAPAQPRYQYLGSQGFGGTVSLALAPKFVRVAPWLDDPNAVVTGGI